MRRLILFLLLLISPFASYGQSAMEIIMMMYKDASAIDGFIAEINKIERVEDEYIIQLSQVTLKKTPFKVYIKQLAPKEGIEVLALKTKPSSKAIINLNSFPWINIYLDPYGALMRRDQHHLVFDSGFDLMIRILKHELSTKISEEKLSRKANVLWKGREMYHLELKNRDYKIVNYTPPQDENLDAIAAKLNVNAYAIIELNKDVDDYGIIDKGQTIKVPNHYAKQLSLLIDKETHLPLVISVYDDKGLFEKYEYNSIIVNPVFAPDEFTVDFNNYNF